MLRHTSNVRRTRMNVYKNARSAPRCERDVEHLSLVRKPIE